MGTNILQIELKIMSREEKSSNDPSPLLKRKRRKVKVDPKLGGKWKVKEKSFSPLPTFSPTNFT